jgi:hypothetical protein
MKTIAFLCVLINAIFATQTTVSMQSETIDSGDAIITTDSKNGTLTISFEGTGSFTTEVPTNDDTYRVNQTTTHNNHIIVYGYTVNKSIREHHAFLIFLDKTGQIIRHDVFDDAPLQEFVNHYDLDGTLIFRMRESINDDGAKEVKNHFVRYDETLSTFQKETIDSVLKVIDVSGNKLIMKPAYDAHYTYGLDADFTQYEPNVMYGAKDKDTFIGSASLFSLNEVTINGEVFSQHIDISYPGYHHIKIDGKELTITIHPENNIIENHETYNGPITLNELKGRLLLNNQVISSNETIKDPGNYTLVIEGTNGYEKRLEFTISSSISGIYNNHVYDSKRTLTFNGVGYLNNRYIETGHMVNKPGLYTLDILGENDYRETLQFEIRSIEEDDSNNTLLYIEIGLLATVAITAGALVVKYKLKA